MVIKMVLADPKTGKSYKFDLDAAKEKAVLGKTIGMEIDAAFLGLSGYKLKLTGGCDKSGFVMKGDLPGQAKKRILGAIGVGFAPKINGQRRRKFIRGNEVSQDVSQLNAKLVVYGDATIEKLLGLEPEEVVEEAAEAAVEEEAPEVVSEEKAEVAAE